MLIQLDKDYRMTSNPKNLILQRRSETKSKEGEITEKWVDDGFYIDLHGLLIGYMRKSIRKSSAKSLEELAEDIKRIEENINNQLGRKYKCKENSIEVD